MSMMEYDVIIMGAGASGCMCALRANKDKKILLIDRNNFAAKKLLATGNGRCNLTFASPLKKDDYNQNIENFLSRFSVKQTLDFFSNIGLVYYSDDEGRIYPISNSARSVLDVICNALACRKNVDLMNDCEIVEVEKSGKFIVKTNKGIFYSKKLVYALGGNCLLSNFNINMRPFTPSLVALKTNSTRLLEGIRAYNVKLSIYEDNCEKFSEIGEILFKNSGISGILAFNASTYFARKGKYDGKIFIDLLPYLSEIEVVDLLRKRKRLNVGIDKIFDGLFAKNLGYHILNLCKFDEKRDVATLNEQELKTIAKHIKKLCFDLKGCYENNQVFSGGIDLNELTENLESKKVNGLFFCGEICDVDGKCGGYNLQWAWTSGAIVGDYL